MAAGFQSISMKPNRIQTANATMAGMLHQSWRSWRVLNQALMVFEAFIVEVESERKAVATERRAPPRRIRLLHPELARRACHSSSREPAPDKLWVRIHPEFSSD